MTDNEIAAVIVSQLDTLMAADPVLGTLAGLTAAQNFQPRQQGAADTPIVYFIKISDRRVGSPTVKDTFVDPVPPDPVGTMRHTESQVYASTFQFMALMPQDPANTALPTASDVLNVVAGIIASDANRAAFLAAGLGILRVADVRNPYFTDDQDRFEASPSFDVVLTHKRVLTTTESVVVTYDAAVNRV